MMRMLLVMMSCGVLVFLVGCSSESDSGMSFDDLAQLEQSEQSELLAMAEQAAGNWRFSSASDYLSQAEEKAYDPDAIGATKRVIRRAREAYQENERRKEEQRRQEEQRRLTAAAGQRQNDNTSNYEIIYRGSPTNVTVRCGRGEMKDLYAWKTSGGGYNWASGDSSKSYASLHAAAKGSCGR